MASRDLRDPKTFITGHDEIEGTAKFYPPRLQRWLFYDEGGMPMAVAYVNKLSANLNDNADIHDCNRRMAEGLFGLVSPESSLIRYVDLAPGYTSMLYRTKSIDYVICVEGEPDCVMEGGDTQRLKRGDVLIQRYTKHAWKNPSSTSWARLIVVSMDCEPLRVNGEMLYEELGRGAAFIPSSGNDV